MTTVKKFTQSQQFWRDHLSQWRESNLSQAAYCRHHRLNQNSFSYHKRKQSTNLVPVEPSGFIHFPLPQARPVFEPVVEPLTLHLTNGMRLSGIAPNNIALVQQLTRALL